MASSNLLRDDDVRTVEDKGRQFVVTSLPRASRLQRPMFVGRNPMTCTYHRHCAAFRGAGHF